MKPEVNYRVESGEMDGVRAPLCTDRFHCWCHVLGRLWARSLMFDMDWTRLWPFSRERGTMVVI